MKPNTHFLSQVVEALGTTGYAVIDDAVQTDVLNSLRTRLHALPPSAFHAAGTGREHDHGLHQDFRSDRIHWLEHGQLGEADWLDWMDELRLHVNQHLYMGLATYEAHFAHYAPGQRYGRHVDAFRGQANRVLSTVLYLNTTWHDADGGELLIYPEHQDDAQDAVRVSPLPGRLVIFLSEEFPHEVLPARKDRHSIAGWFRVRSSSPV